MGSCVEVTLTLGGDRDVLGGALHEYLVAPVFNGQCLTLVSGRPLNEQLEGSGQAGTMRVYVALLRKISSTEVVEHLAGAPWTYGSAVLVVENEWSDGPDIYMFPGAEQVRVAPIRY